MVRQVGLVAVDADQVLERAGDAGLLVRLQLRHVEDDVGLDQLARHEVAMPAAAVRLVERTRVVHRHAERRLVAGDRLEEAVAREIEADVVGLGPARRWRARCDAESSSRVTRRKSFTSISESPAGNRARMSAVPLAAINCAKSQPCTGASPIVRRPGRALEDVAAQGIEQRRMCDQALQTGVVLVVVGHPVGLYDHVHAWLRVLPIGDSKRTCPDARRRARPRRRANAARRPSSWARCPAVLEMGRRLVGSHTRARLRPTPSRYRAWSSSRRVEQTRCLSTDDALAGAGSPRHGRGGARLPRIRR